MIRAEDVKALRDLTGVSMMECKRALESTGGDREKALEILKSRGASVAQKKLSREQNSGVVHAYVHGGRRGALIKLLCETDFVARNEEFQALAHDLAMQVVASDARTVEELYALPYLKDESITVKERIDQAVGIIGENISVGGFSRLEL
jgi:elongation factor Ts